MKSRVARMRARRSFDGPSTSFGGRCTATMAVVGVRRKGVEGFSMSLFVARAECIYTLCNGRLMFRVHATLSLATVCARYNSTYTFMRQIMCISCNTGTFYTCTECWLST